MVFSLFSRKDESDTRKERDAAAARGADSGHGPSSAVAPNSDIQREIARRTKEKIDLIESEMIAAGLSIAPSKKNGASPPKPVQAPAGGQATPASAHPIPHTQGVAPNTAPSVVMSTSIVIGNTEHADEIHVSGSSLPPELEEAAILYANGQAKAAEATLKGAIRGGTLAAATQQAWLMLFDVYQGTGQKDEFDSQSLDFAAQFEQFSPAWRDTPKRGGESEKASPTGTSIHLPAQITSDLTKPFEQVKRAATNKRPAVLEFAAVKSIENAASEHLLELINSIKANRQDLVLAHPARLFEAVSANIETGRRDENQASWMLALEMLRVQGLKQQFDDLSIDYCVTYEVSPPSWEPMPAWIRSDLAATSSTLIEAKAEAAAESGGFALRGEIIGRMQTELAEIRAYGLNRHDLVIDCRELTRLDFVAAGELLNEVVTLRNNGKSLVFLEPNHLVLALMKVMGIHELADIRRRKF